MVGQVTTCWAAYGRRGELLLGLIKGFVDFLLSEGRFGRADGDVGKLNEVWDTEIGELDFSRHLQDTLG